MTARKKVLKFFIIIILAVFLLSTGLISVLYLGGNTSVSWTWDVLSWDVVAQTWMVATWIIEKKIVDTWISEIKTVEIWTVSPIIVSTWTK